MCVFIHSPPLAFCLDLVFRCARHADGCVVVSLSGVGGLELGVEVEVGVGIIGVGVGVGVDASAGGGGGGGGASSGGAGGLFRGIDSRRV